MAKKEKKATKRDCYGCYNEIYNNRESGDCWSLAEAVMTKAIDIHVDEMPPHRGRETLRPNCYHRQRWIRIPKSRLINGRIR